MAIVLGRNEIDIKRTGRVVTVADNDVARLMYYLNCVCTSIDCNQDEDIRRFTNHANWMYLSDEERKLLVLLCYTFSPDVFEGKVFFHIEELCIDSSNEFYEINQISDRLVAVESIIIAGRQHHVTNIMVYKMSWMRKYYLEPMQRLARRFANESSGYESSRLLTSSRSNNDSDCCCCTIL
jgi:hypothetical protein